MPRRCPDGRPGERFDPMKGLYMFSFFRRRARKTRYAWTPALDLTDPRVAAVLKTFGWA